MKSYTNLMDQLKTDIELLDQAHVVNPLLGELIAGAVVQIENTVSFMDESFSKGFYCPLGETELHAMTKRIDYYLYLIERADF